MEREFGISCPSGPSKEHSQEDILDLETCDSQEELERLQSTSQKEEEKHKVWRTLYDLNKQLLPERQTLRRLPFRLLVSTKPGGQAVNLLLTGLEHSVQAGPLLLFLVPLSSTGEHPGLRHLCLQVGTVPHWVQVTLVALQPAWSVRQSD